MNIEQSQEQNGTLVATYGTLRHGLGNWSHFLNNEHCTFLGEQRTEPNYKMVSLGGFPGVILNGNQQITIDVFRVSSERVLKNLDSLEGYPSFYQKTDINTKWGKAKMYILSEEKYGNLSVIESGDWKEYRKSKTY